MLHQGLSESKFSDRPYMFGENNLPKYICLSVKTTFAFWQKSSLRLVVIFCRIYKYYAPALNAQFTSIQSERHCGPVLMDIVSLSGVR